MEVRRQEVILIIQVMNNEGTVWGDRNGDSDKHAVPEYIEN